VADLDMNGTINLEELKFFINKLNLELDDLILE